MSSIVLTYRPVSFKQLMSTINLIARIDQKCPYDHGAYLRDGIIYESIAGPGVHEIPYDEWIIGREGSWLTFFDIDPELIDLNVFNHFKGTKYDYMANLWWLINQQEKLKKNPTKRLYCTELLGLMLKQENYYEWTPRTVAQFCIQQELPSRIINVPQLV